MGTLIQILITGLECWLLFTICYSLAKKDDSGNPLIDKKLTVYTIILLAIIYIIINLKFLL